MNAFAELSLLFAYVAIVMGTLVIVRNNRDPVHRMFFLFCAGAFYWCFAEYGMRHAVGMAAAQIWLKVFSFWPITTVFMLHFALLYTGILKPGRRFLPLFLLYAPALAFSLLDLFTMRISSTPVLAPWGWTYGLPQTWEKTASVIWAIAVTAAAVVICVRFVFTTSLTRRRTQGLFILFGFLVLIIAGYSTDVASFLFNRRIPEMSSLGYALGTGFIGYAIFRYNLFNLAPVAVAREIIDTISDILLLVDDKGTIVSANRAATALLGYAAAELVGKPLESVVADKDRVSVNALVDGRNIGPGNGHLEINMQTKQARSVPFSVSNSTVRDSQGIYQGTIFVAHDVSGYKRVQEHLFLAKQEAEKANRLKSAFLSNMSHELRTPLNSIIVLSGVLNRRLADTVPAEERGYLEIVERNGKNLLALINDILDLSRIEAGREEISFSRFSVRECVGELVAMLEAQAQEKGISLLARMPDDLPSIVSDAVLFRRILQNIVGNAVKFTEYGHVVVSAEIQGTEILISVADTGIGIAAEQISPIFEEFHQAEAGTSRKYGGTGLGLAIAQKSARLLGGGISVQSAPGEGSTFTLRLPLTVEFPFDEVPVKPGAEATGIEARLGEGPAGTEPRRPRFAQPGKPVILVVEDNPDNLRATRALLEERFQVIEADDERVGVEQARSYRPDLILMDIALPGLDDGVQALMDIRKDDALRHIPVIAVTASVMKGNREEILTHGFDGCISKPIDPEALMKAIGSFLYGENEKSVIPAPVGKGEI